MLNDLLPRGRAWPREKVANLYKLLDGLATELWRIDGRAGNLLDEADPRTATELLPEWEAVVGIPDACLPPEPTLERRRRNVVARLTQMGSLNASFYVEFAAFLGYEIEITEFRPFRAGISKANDPLTNGDWIHAFQVTAPIETINYFSAGRNQVGDPLAEWGNDFLECSINKRKPAGKIVLYAYTA